MEKGEGLPFGALRPLARIHRSLPGCGLGESCSGPREGGGHFLQKKSALLQGPDLLDPPFPGPGCGGLSACSFSAWGEDGRCSPLPGFEFWTLDVGLRV